jgi:ligand-binding SRPBCC domain-containing protein
MRHRLEQRQLVPAAIEDVCAFFEDPYELERLTPPFLRFRVLEVSTPELQVGTRIRYRLRLRGLPLGWESLISDYVPGASFTDEMLSGPYRSWRHRHDFRAVPGGVEIADAVDYELPLGPLGRIAHAAWVRRELAQIFDYRRQAIAARFGALP